MTTITTPPARLTTRCDRCGKWEAQRHAAYRRQATICRRCWPAATNTPDPDHQPAHARRGLRALVGL